jgi:hypothetical protein
MARGRASAALAAAALALAAAPAAAQPQTTVELALGAHLYLKPFGLTYAYGRIKPPDGVSEQQYANQTILLYQSAYPFQSWQQVATLTTDWQGYYSFNEMLTQNTAFRAIWQTDPPLQSKDRLVAVPVKVSLEARGRRGHVTFAGSTYPALPGTVIDLQKLGRRGRFRTVATATLASGARFQRSLRIRSGGVFRALVRPGGQHGAGVSRPLRVP